MYNQDIGEVLPARVSLLSRVPLDSPNSVRDVEEGYPEDCVQIQVVAHGGALAGRGSAGLKTVP